MKQKKTLEPVAETFSKETFHGICDRLAEGDVHLQGILDVHGYPPMWTRDNSFETMVHIILEQQVSLASALSALKMLQHKTGGVTPEAVLLLSDEEMRACYVSRQKMGYIRGLASAIVGGDLELEALPRMSNDEIRLKLIQLKGIGNWTIDIYLMFVLQRSDIFPIGDLAAVNAFKRVKAPAGTMSREDIQELAGSWAPNRTVATMMLWHYYLCNIGKKAKV